MAEQHADAKGDADGLIRVLVHGPVGGLGSLNGLVSNAAIHLLAAPQCGGKALAGFLDFFPGHVGGGVHQRARIFGQLTHVITDCLCLFAHMFGVF